MDYVTSRVDLLDTFKYSEIELSNEEQEIINSIFSNVDKWNSKGKACKRGDNNLNSKEFYLFSQQIKKIKPLYEKFTKTGLFNITEDRYDLKILFLEGTADYKFIKSLPEEEVQELIKDMSFERDGWQINKKKAEQFFKIQLELLENNNCYTEDLKALVKTVLAGYSNNSQAANRSSQQLTLDSLKKHINSRLIATRANKNVEIKEPNGKIDANFKQGHTGDCWLLASIKAIASDEKGLEKLNNMISVQKDGEKLISVTVHLQGKDYVISSEELHSSVEYATGDLDVRALEIAANRFCLENSYKDITGGGHSGFGYAILLGDADKVKEFGNMKPQDFMLSKTFEQDLKTANRVGTVGGAYYNTYAIDVETGEKVKLFEDHEYALIGSDSEFAYLSNPHDSSKKLKLEIDNFTNTFANGLLYEI